MDSFNLYVKNEKAATYRVVTILFLFISFFSFVFLAFYNLYQTQAIIILGLFSCFLTLKWMMRKKGSSQSWIDEWSYGMLAICWMIFLFFVPALICLAMGFSYFIGKKDIHFHINHSGIHQLNFPKRNYVWASLSNVILKDGLLTIDFIDNRLIQLPISNFLEIDERDFNQKVQEQIKLKTSSKA